MTRETTGLRFYELSRFAVPGRCPWRQVHGTRTQRRSAGCARPTPTVTGWSTRSRPAYAQGLLTTDELAARTSQALAARTYADLTAAGAVLAERPAAPSIHPPARARVSRKAVAYGTSAIVLSPAMIAAFLTFYGGFIILFLVACAGVVVSAAPMAPRRPGALPSAGRR